MDKISDRAIAASIKPDEIPHDPFDTDRLSEEWRIAKSQLIDLESNAEQLAEGRTIFRDALIDELIATGLSEAAAKRAANTCERYKNYIRKMHDAKRAMRVKQLDVEMKDRAYWKAVRREAAARDERKRY